MEDVFSSKIVDHLGLVSGMCDELDLVNQIDRHIPQDLEQREISVGNICKALIINGLGFVQRRLYLVSSFFEKMPTELLLGDAIKPEHLNDTVMGRALDQIHAYGTTELFSQLCPVICQNLGLSPSYAHLDSTTFHLIGNYNDESPPQEGEQILHLTKGYSRDHRPELNQVVLNLITENQAGIPLHMEALSGNTSDKTSFRETINTHIEQLQNVSNFDYLTFDSAGYTAQNIQENSAKVKWISRVPETVKECKELVSSDLIMSPLPQEGYAYSSFCSRYAGVKQRWLVIYSQQAYERELKTLIKRYQKDSLKECKLVQGLEKKQFSCREDALAQGELLRRSLKKIQIESLEVQRKEVYQSRGRPKQGAQADKIYYTLKFQLSCSLATYNSVRRKKGRFVLATNELDESKLPDSETLAGYKGLSKTERGFRFLKDPQFVASRFFVKKPERLEALTFIMTLCLAVYAALEFRIREGLKAQKETFPNQLGKPIANPTARWVFECFRGIHVLYGGEETSLLNLRKMHLTIIQVLGAKYKKYYLLN